MKVEVKKKFDMNKTDNKKIIFKPWEKMLMDLLEVEKKILCSIKFEVEYLYMYSLFLRILYGLAIQL